MSPAGMNLGISFGTSSLRSAWVGADCGATGGALPAVECDEPMPAAFHAGPSGTAIGASAFGMLHDPVARRDVRNRIARDLGKQSLYHIAGRDYSPVQVASRILQGLREAMERKAGGPFARVAIAHPVWFDAVAEAALREAAVAAGLGSATLLTQAEATAVALLRAGHSLGERVLVVDMGAASTDLALLARESSGAYSPALRPRSLSVGGDDLDLVLYAHVAELARRQAGHAVIDPDAVDPGVLDACRRVKEALSGREHAIFEHPGGEGSSASLQLSVSRADLEALARPRLEEVVRAARESFESARDRGRPVDRIILAGGGSLMPLAQRLLHAGLPDGSILVDDRAMGAAIGAAWIAAGPPPVYQPQQAAINIHPAPGPGATRPDGLEALLKSGAFQTIAEEASKRRLVFLIAGRTGVGKSSTINSLLGRQVVPVGDYEPTTFQVQEYPVEMEGIPFCVVDTPGLCDRMEDEGLDSVYLGRMQAAVREFHSLWFVTPLNETRVRSDERRAIRLLSQAFVDRGRVWQSALIVFTFAGKVEPDEYANALATRTRLIRQEIALHAGAEIAAKVPSVAIENEADTTPDGKPWRGELYVKVLTSMNREGIITFFLGTSHLLPQPAHRGRPEDDGRRDRDEPRRKRSRPIDEDDDDAPRPPRSGSMRSDDFTEEQKSRIFETVRDETIRRWEERGRSVGTSIGSFLGGSSGAKTGGEIGGSIGRAIGRFASWLFG